MGRARRPWSYIAVKSLAAAILLLPFVICGATSASLLYGYGGGAAAGRRFGGPAGRSRFVYGYAGQSSRSIRSLQQDDEDAGRGVWACGGVEPGLQERGGDGGGAATGEVVRVELGGDGCGVNATVCFDQTVYKRRSTCCEDVCVNTRSDIMNCGGCGVRCPAGLVCCKGSCVNLLSDNRHCGKCKHRCPDADCELGLCGYGT